MMEVLEGLYPLFLDIGYSPSKFWASSLDEIYDLIESFARREKRRMKERESRLKEETAAMYIQAIQIGEMIGHVMRPSSDETITPLSKYYPELFPDENKENEEEKIKNDFALHKARMEEYAFRHNRALKERGGDHGRDDA